MYYFLPVKKGAKAGWTCALKPVQSSRKDSPVI